MSKKGADGNKKRGLVKMVKLIYLHDDTKGGKILPLSLDVPMVVPTITLEGRYITGYVGKTSSMSMLESRYTLKGREHL